MRPCRLTAHSWDGEPPVVGGWVVPSGPRSRAAYEIVGVRLMAKATVDTPKYALTCVRHPRGDVPEGATRYWFKWDRR